MLMQHKTIGKMKDFKEIPFLIDLVVMISILYETLVGKDIFKLPKCLQLLLGKRNGHLL